MPLITVAADDSNTAIHKKHGQIIAEFIVKQIACCRVMTVTCACTSYVPIQMQKLSPHFLLKACCWEPSWPSLPAMLYRMCVPPS